MKKSKKPNLWKQAQKLPPLSKERKHFIEKEMNKIYDTVSK